MDGRPLPTAGEKARIMLNKPKGYVTTAHDEKDRQRVTETSERGCMRGCTLSGGSTCIRKEILLICTETTASFANRSMPSHEVEKCYLTWVQAGTSARLSVSAIPDGDRRIHDARARGRYNICAGRRGLP